MGKSIISTEWTICDSETMKLHPTTRIEWEVKDESNAIVTTLPPQHDDRRRRASKTSHKYWRLLIFAITLLLLASFIGVERLANRAERNIAQTEREIELAVEADSWLRDSASPKPHIQSIELHNDLAIVQMSEDDGVIPEAGPVVAGTAYYRYSAEGWKRIEPNDANRGLYRYKETAHLLFQYYQVDQSLVEAVVPTVETFNAALYRDIGLHLPPAHDKVTVRIAIVAATQPVAPFKLVGYVTWESNGIVVLSPRLSRVSTILASTDVLEQAVRANIAHQIVLLAVEEYQPQAVWRPLVDGLQLWANAAYREFDFNLANSPATMDNLLHGWLTNKAPLQLPVLSEAPSLLSSLEETPGTDWQQLVLSKTVIDYVIATYGRHSLARLLAGMHQYDSWQSLVPAVFHISMEEFERNWHAYLAARYDQSP
jgi:hypothetical protein